MVRIAKKTILPLLVFFSFVLLISCDQEKKPTKSSSTGTPSEIIVVSENNLWKSSAGDSVRALFAGPVPGLPQPEPFYKLIQVKEDEFGRLLKLHRNVFIITIDSSRQTPLAELRRDIWATPQRVVKISAATVEGIKESFESRKEEILNLYDNAEIERLQKLYGKSRNKQSVERVGKKFGISLDVPADYYLASEKDNFIWIRRETNLESQGILIYSYPYTDTAAFKSERIKSIRNQFTQLYVPGPSDSSYMIVADEFVQPIHRTINLKNQNATEIRGLWEVKKDFMGGPFVSYTFVDERKNMVITLDGYVYAPGIPKLALLKQVQSILLSFNYIDNQ
ncbi:MAG: DUF4837 family protein [Lentimicrobium sp.]|nr:DUF4837 family protein [Lentimicrobium sp.]